MPLHDRETIRDQFDDCVFADRDLTRPVAKYRFPQEGTLPRDAFQLVSDELMLDGNARQNLATFCQTWEEPEVLALMARFRNALPGHRRHQDPPECDNKPILPPPQSSVAGDDGYGTVGKDRIWP